MQRRNLLVILLTNVHCILRLTPRGVIQRILVQASNILIAVGDCGKLADADDVLDCTQSSEQLGKTAGKDAAASKATYPALFGIEKSTQMADELVNRGCSELDSFGASASTLKELAHFLVERKK